jgi:hypothetical protein
LMIKAAWRPVSYFSSGLVKPNRARFRLLRRGVPLQWLQGSKS